MCVLITSPPSISLPSLLRNAQMLLTVHSPNNGDASSSAASIRGESEEAFFYSCDGEGGNHVGKSRLDPEEDREGKNSPRAVGS